MAVADVGLGAARSLLLLSLLFGWARPPLTFLESLMVVALFAASALVLAAQYLLSR